MPVATGMAIDEATEEINVPEFDEDTTPDLPLSRCCKTASSALKSGKYFVHQNAILRPLSTIRCFRMKRITRTKKAKAERMSMRSSQSDFSSAVMICFEVDMTDERVSCCSDVERKDELEESRS